MFKFSDKNTKTVHHRFSHNFREGKEDDVVSVFLLVTLNTFTPFLVFLLFTLNKQMLARYRL